MKAFKGIIALDIDGTITVDKHILEKKVGDYLNHLIAEGWGLIFLTGRSFAFSQSVLSSIRGEYFFSPQNGASLYSMPRGICLKKYFISTSLLKQLDSFFHKTGSGLLVESGKENEDICYYKPKDFTAANLEYLSFRRKITPEKWVAVNTFDSLSIPEFAVGKYFGSFEETVNLTKKLEEHFSLSLITIQDPFRPGYYLAHLNAPQASKGKILEDVISLQAPGLPVIAAGDDYNDVGMLEKSRVKIVMKNAPVSLHGLADILAPPAEEQGIIKGLEEAIWKVSLK